MIAHKSEVIYVLTIYELSFGGLRAETVSNEKDSYLTCQHNEFLVLVYSSVTFSGVSSPRKTAFNW